MTDDETRKALAEIATLTADGIASLREQQANNHIEQMDLLRDLGLKMQTIAKRVEDAEKDLDQHTSNRVLHRPLAPVR